MRRPVDIQIDNQFSFISGGIEDTIINISISVNSVRIPDEIDYLSISDQILSHIRQDSK